MKLSQVLVASEAKLKAAGISSARLDILILLEDALHKDRAWLLTHPEIEVSDSQTRRLERKLERRARHVPLAYIRGHTEFYGRSFKVNRHVLEPRPESETMIELLKKLRLPLNPAIADVGTGNGAIGITAALEIPSSIVDLYDISSGAIAVAKHNIHLHELRLHVRKMNLLSRPLRPYDAILANLPYVPDKWQINEAAMAEPKIAIFGGPDGLDVYRKFFHQLQRFTWKPEYVLTEALPPQHPKLTNIAVEHGFRLLKTGDFIQVFTPVKIT
ncbi:peptide chain release factor N(5)-glutamine methyltransferase [Candidatus Saccharibacteria bacterium]|nr:peptide chain release factor N(5)-glutamine methyltransferase [Candidatus Saccharibacteria bacterium]